MALTFVKKHNAESVAVQISRHLRRQIDAGVLQPGQQLPSNADLASRWKVSNLSIQQGMKPLVAEGLLVRRRKLGTFVGQPADHAMIGILFGPSLTSESANYYRAMARGFRHELSARKFACRIYDGFIGANREPVPEHADVRRHFKADVQNQRFAGLIEFATG